MRTAHIRALDFLARSRLNHLPLTLGCLRCSVELYEIRRDKYLVVQIAMVRSIRICSFRSHVRASLGLIASVC